MAPKVERRVDWSDGSVATYDEFVAYYKGKYKMKAINAYWEECEIAKGKGGAKAKAKVKAKAKAEPKVKAKAKAKEKAKAVTEPPQKIMYFGINCKCNSTPTICLEIARLPYEVQIVDMAADWPELKPKTPTNSLPVVVLKDGTWMGESAVCKRVCAAAAGLLGVGKDYATSEFLVTMMEQLWKDLMFPNLPTILNKDSWTKEQTAKANETIPKVKEFLEKLEPYLKEKKDKPKDRFTSRVTVGEIDVWHRLHQCVNGCIPDAADGGLKDFYERMSKVKGVQNFVEGRSKWGDGAKVNVFVPMP